jgi:2-phospho-L-lactate guanylyltransferase
MILIPVKDLSNAKARLSPLLNADQRATLAQSMIEDVLYTLHSWPARPEIAVVSSDPFTTYTARSLKFRVIEDRENRGETEAIEMATQVCAKEGVRETLVIPGDIPLMRVWELERIMEMAPAEGSVMVPAYDGRGTNAILRRPAALFPLRFGNDSFQPHLQSAQGTGLDCIVLDLPGISLDVDTPEDLKQLLATPTESRTQKLLRHWDLSQLDAAS